MTEKIKKNKKLALSIILGLFITGIILAITLSGYVYTQLKKITPVHIFKTQKDLGISPLLQSQIDSLSEPPLNIALFGLDKREGKDYVNADVIMLLSINKDTKKIKIASVMRDTYVKIEGKGMDKINAAFNIGGAQLAIKTINQNFNLDIKEFVSVDIKGMSKVIDALGGITLDVKKEEMGWVNGYLDEAYNDSIPFLTKWGVQNLNGKQAVAYTRIRYTSGNDAERTERQRKVLTLLLKKLKEAGPMQYPILVSQLLPYVETSFGRKTLLKVGAEVFISNIRTIEQKRFPLDSESKGQFIDSIWYLVPNLKATQKSIRTFIFDGKL
ncbi:MAG: LCP family protein [Pyrinomonadaceae bacterium]|nr:LCP family protein [Sphingobacteriaceae bacterium]